MSALLLDGRTIAREIFDRLKQEIASEKLDVGFAAILVGDDPASHIYIRLKEKAAKEVGIRFERILLESDTSQEALEATITALNQRPDIHAILLQLPLPSHLNADAAIIAINPSKDADGFHPQHTIEPALAQAIMGLIDSTGANLQGRSAAIICNSPDVFAPPIMQSLGNREVVATAHRPSDDHTQESARAADILIVAVGQPYLITSDWIKPGAMIVDVGINKKEDTVVGDVSPVVDAIAAWRSPVPGGVGPMTIAMLLKNTLAAARGTVQ